MKNLFILLLVITTNASGQYIVAGATNLGPNVGIGYLHRTGVDVVVQYDAPIFSAMKPFILSGLAGYEFLITDRWRVTPRVGGGHSQRKSWGSNHMDDKHWSPMYELEGGFEIDGVRFSLVAKYYERTYVGLTFKKIFNRK